MKRKNKPPKIRPGTIEKSDNWIFLKNKEALVPFRTFSNQTPATPDRIHADPTAINPKNFSVTPLEFSSLI